MNASENMSVAGNVSKRRIVIVVLVVVVLVVVLGVIFLPTYTRNLNNQRVIALAEDVFASGTPTNANIADQMRYVTGVDEPGWCKLVVYQEMTAKMHDKQLMAFYEDVTYTLDKPPLFYNNEPVEPMVILATGFDPSWGVMWRLQVEMAFGPSLDPRCWERD